MRTMSVGAKLRTEAFPSGSADEALAPRLIAIWQLQKSADSAKFHNLMEWILARRHPTLYCDQLLCLLLFVFPMCQVATLNLRV